MAFFTFLSADAQQVSFIHMQTENNQPYTAYWNGNTYLSSPNGHITIPQVPPGEQTISILFSPETASAYSFIVSMTDAPRGFSIRQSVDNSWSLFDLVGYNLLKGTAIAKTLKVAPIIKPGDLISQSPSEIQTTVNTPVKTIEVAVIKPPVTPSQLIKPSAILKIFDKTGTTGIDQVYTITTGAKTDTIALFIPILAESETKPAGAAPSSYISFPSGNEKKKMMASAPEAYPILSRFTYLPKETYATLFPGTSL